VRHASWVVGSFVALALAVALLGCGRPAGSSPVVQAPAAGGALSPMNQELVIHHRVQVGNKTLARLKLRFVGAEHASAQALSKELGVAKYTHLTNEILERDDLVLTAWYYDRGYLELKVSHEAEVEGDDLVVTYRVDEGHPYTVSSLSASEPAHGLKAEPLGWKAPIAVGQTFSRIAMVAALAAVRTAYADLGYAYVEADPITEIDRDKHQVGIVVHVVRGKAQFFEEVAIVGNHKVSSELVRKQLTVQPNDRYGETALNTSKKRLLDTGWFTRVDVSTKKGSNDHRIVATFEVEETKGGPATHVVAR